MYVCITVHGSSGKGKGKGKGKASAAKKGATGGKRGASTAAAAAKKNTRTKKRASDDQIGTQLRAIKGIKVPVQIFHFIHTHIIRAARSQPPFFVDSFHNQTASLSAFSNYMVYCCTSVLTFTYDCSVMECVPLPLRVAEVTRLTCGKTGRKEE